MSSSAISAALVGLLRDSDLIAQNGSSAGSSGQKVRTGQYLSRFRQMSATMKGRAGQLLRFSFSSGLISWLPSLEYSKPRSLKIIGIVWSAEDDVSTSSCSNAYRTASTAVTSSGS